MSVSEDLVDSLALLKAAIRSTIMIQEGLIRSIEKIQKEVLHSYELKKTLGPYCNQDPLEITIPKEV
jgi:hypothetical protein